MRIKKIVINGQKYAYAGNPTPKMIEDMAEVLEDIAMGRIVLPEALDIDDQIIPSAKH